MSEANCYINNNNKSTEGLDMVISLSMLAVTQAPGKEHSVEHTPKQTPRGDRALPDETVQAKEEGSLL